MSPGDADPSVWKWIAQNAVYPLSALMAALWATLNHRITHIEKKIDVTVPRTEFERAMNESKEDRASLRGDIRDLFGKVENSKDMNAQRIDAVYDRLSEKMDKLRDEMNGGFRRILEDRARKD